MKILQEQFLWTIRVICTLQNEEWMILELKVFESSRIIKYSEEIEIFVFSGSEK